MKDPLATDLPTIFLKPGEVVFSAEPTVVSTLLGSCISITMFSRRHRLGAICHCQLPANRDDHGNCSSNCMEAYRYVDCAVRQMLKMFRERKIPPREIEVKVFGGADMFRSGNRAGQRLTIGAQNIEAAGKVLDELRLHPVVSDTGGNRGRKIVFYTHTGDVFLKRLNKQDMAELTSEVVSGRGC